MDRKKKLIIIFSVIIVIFIISSVAFFLINKNVNNTEIVNAEINKLKELPKPEVTGGTRGELGIDKNINEATIDEYLNRPDSVYRDMRMLEDPGNYENIGGDRFLSGYIEGFEVIPLPYIIPVTGLPSEVGDTYTGTTLFYNDNGTYVANYEESMDIIEEIFPKDKIIFLMCGGGGYSGITKNFLVSLGWNENKIYNTGGYWYYKGEHNINIKKEVDGVVSYDFDSVPYHNIEFDKLTKSSNYKAPVIKVTEIKINTSKIELEEGTSFKLNAIVLPNEATNKEVKWTSSDKAVATVTNEGLVQAIGVGNTTITVESIEGNKSTTCNVTVNKKVVNTRIKIDDLSKESKEFASYDFDAVWKEFEYLDLKYDSEGNFIPNKYYDFDSVGARINDMGKEESKKQSEKLEQTLNNRVKIINNLLDTKKSFIILYHTKECEARDYSVVDGAERILKENNYSYFNVADSPSGDNTLDESKLDLSKTNGGSIIIIKNGEIYASVNPDVDAIKNDKETRNWLSKYIDIVE